MPILTNSKEITLLQDKIKIYTKAMKEKDRQISHNKTVIATLEANVKLLQDKVDCVNIPK